MAIKVRMKTVHHNFFCWVVNQKRNLSFIFFSPVFTWIFGINLLHKFPSKDELIEYETWIKSKIQSSENLEPNFDLTPRFFPIQALDSFPKKKRWIFFDLHPRNTVTSNVIYEMYLSSQTNSSYVSQYHNFTELSQISISKLLEDIEYDTNYSNILVFEVHTTSNLNGGIFGKEQVIKLRNNEANLVLPICFDIYRNFDQSFIKYWESSCLAFLHIDDVSAKNISSSKPLIFWPFILPTIDRDTVPFNLKDLSSSDQSFLFSGSFKGRERMSSLLNLKMGAIKYGYRIRIRVRNKRQDNSDERIAYLKDLNSALAVLNFNARPEVPHPLLTFRAIETLIVSGCLLDQCSNFSNSSLSKLAVPYKHFIPFKDDLELIKLCWFLNKNQDEALKLRLNCRSLRSELLTESNLWRYLEHAINDLY